MNNHAPPPSPYSQPTVTMSQLSQNNPPQGNVQPLTQHALLNLQIEEMRRRGEPTEETENLLKYVPKRNSDSRSRSRSTVVMDETADPMGGGIGYLLDKAKRLSPSARARIREDYELHWREERGHLKRRLKEDYGVSRIDDVPSEVRRSWLGSNSDPPSFTSGSHSSQDKNEGPLRTEARRRRVSTPSESEGSDLELNWDHDKERTLLKEEMLAAARLQPKRCQTLDINAVPIESSDKRETPPDMTGIPDMIFPPHRSVDGVVELSRFLACSGYIISLGGPPVPELKYGIIIVPCGEEELLFTGYGDHAALPVEMQDEIRAKSKAMNAEEFRKQIANDEESGFPGTPDLDDDDREFYRRRWLARKGIFDAPHITTSVADKTHDQIDDDGNAESRPIEERGNFQNDGCKASPTPEASLQQNTTAPPSPHSTPTTPRSSNTKGHAIPRSESIKIPVVPFQSEKAEKKKRKGAWGVLRSALSKMKSRRKQPSSNPQSRGLGGHRTVLVKNTRVRT